MFTPNELDDLLQCFLAESIEHLEGIEPLLLKLETADPQEREKLTNRVFRAAHSIKGSSGMFGFTHIHELSHKTEWLLDFLRSGKILPTSDLIDLLLRSFDCLRHLVDNAAQSNTMDISDMLQDLEAELNLISQGQNEAPAKGPANAEVGKAPPAPKSFSLQAEDLDNARKEHLHIYFSRLDLITDLDLRGKSLTDFLKVLNAMGTLRHFHVDFDTFLETESTGNYRLPAEILFITEIGPDSIDLLLETPAGSFQALATDEPQGAVQSLPAGAPPAPITSPSPETPPTTMAMASPTPGSVPLPSGKNDSGSDWSQSGTSSPAPAESIQAMESAEPTLRVKVSLLENLMNLAGELVLSRNQLREALNRHDMRAIRTSGQRMGQVTTELQETIMLTRLQPLERVFSKFPRMIRDLSKQMQKEIQLTMEGREVELDKTLIEGLSDPLTHMIRNAADHGVETTEERLQAGKRNPAHIKLLAFYEAGRVIIEVADDGRGIDGEKVCRKAVERNLVSPEKARTLSNKEKQHLIFLPGLSTAESVSDVSGRGVGMDVVKANIDRLGGKVDIASELGKGSSFKIKLPLTLAIIPSLILQSSGEMFAIPQVNVLEMLLIPAEMVKHRIEVIGTQEVLVLRGKLLPLISLNQFLGTAQMYQDPGTESEHPDRRQRTADRRSPHHGSLTTLPGLPGSDSSYPPRGNGRRYHTAGALNIVIVTTGHFSFGIIVDKPMFTEEIVVKQLGKDLKGLTEYSGATIMGDGRIALIIDVLGLAARANILGQQHGLTSGMTETGARSTRDSETVPFLAFHYGGPETLVLPLYLVTRLEKIQPKSVFSCGAWQAIQYGERMLPVFFLSDAGQITPLRPDQEWGVVVIRICHREIGLVAALPIQVIEMKPDFDATVLKQPGISGSKVWDQKTILFVDVWEVLNLKHPELLQFDQDSLVHLSHLPQVLVLEPFGFFQHQSRLQLENHGFRIQIAQSLEETEHLFTTPGNRFHGFMADLALLQRDGFTCLRRWRQQEWFKGMKVCALSMNGTATDIDLSMEGIEQVFLKLEDQLLTAWLDEFKPNSGDQPTSGFGGWSPPSLLPTVSPLTGKSPGI
jgi:two-component system chemotaxis sensor kinase CheA